MSLMRNKYFLKDKYSNEKLLEVIVKFNNYEFLPHSNVESERTNVYSLLLLLCALTNNTFFRMWVINRFVYIFLECHSERMIRDLNIINL